MISSPCSNTEILLVSECTHTDKTIGHEFPIFISPPCTYVEELQPDPDDYECDERYWEAQNHPTGEIDGRVSTTLVCPDAETTKHGSKYISYLF